MHVLDITLRWLVVVLEIGLLARIARTGIFVTLPGFSLYLAASCVTALMFATNHYAANIYGQVAIWPLRAWAAIEAIRFRTRYIDDYMPPRFGSMGRWMLAASAWFAVVIGGVMVDDPVQFNVPQVAAHIRNVLNGGVAGGILLAWTVIVTKRIRSPKRATTHFTLLTLWFFVYAAVNTVPIGTDDNRLWLELAIGSNLVGCLILCCWISLLRPRIDPLVIGQYGQSPLGSQPNL